MRKICKQDAAKKTGEPWGIFANKTNARRLAPKQGEPIKLRRKNEKIQHGDLDSEGASEQETESKGQRDKQLF